MGGGTDYIYIYWVFKCCDCNGGDFMDGTNAAVNENTENLYMRVSSFARKYVYFWLVLWYV